MSSPGYRRDSKCSCFWECIVPVTRFWGVATAVVLGGVGADVTVHGHVMGIYIIIAAIGVFFLEIVWAVTLFLQLCIRNDESAFFRCWEAILWINGWKKTLIYGAFAVAPILWPNKLWLSYVAGGQLIVLALLHLVLVFRKRRGRARKKDSLLSYGDGDSLESCKFEDVLDDTMPGPIPVESHSLADSLPGDQDAILEI